MCRSISNKQTFYIVRQSDGLLIMKYTPGTAVCLTISFIRKTDKKPDYFLYTAYLSLPKLATPHEPTRKSRDRLERFE